jgi:hypothetical protein
VHPHDTFGTRIIINHVWAFYDAMWGGLEGEESVYEGPLHKILYYSPSLIGFSFYLIFLKKNYEKRS